MGKSGQALLLVAVVLGMVVFSAVPARAAAVSLDLYGSAASGWGTTSASESNPATPITVNQGDVVTITLHSTDGFPHQLLIDYSGNGANDAGEPMSAQFTTTTTLTFTASQAGTFSFLCLVHPGSMKGTLVVQGTGTTPSGGASDSGTTLVLLGIVILVVAAVGVSILVVRKRH